VLDLYHGRGAFEAVLADEDVEEDEGLAGVHTRSADKNSGRSRVNGCGTCGSHLDRPCKKLSCARSSGLPPKKPLLCSWRWKTPRKSTVRGSGPGSSELQRDASGLRPFPCKKMGCCVAQREPTSG
jgi:hypothetical protein